jgi:hypothetical protein
MEQETQEPKHAQLDTSVVDHRPYYVNKHGSRVYLGITRHALIRVSQRTQLMGDSRYKGMSAEGQVRDLFLHAHRVLNLSGKEEKRLDKHGKDTMFFRNGDYTFVVQDCTVVTVEISAKGMRHLNINVVKF